MMTRRRLLTATFWALAGACARPRPASARPGKQRGKIAVVGAGIAGLGAARELADRGFEVIVLEVRRRLGGRIWTDRSLGLPIDLGAQWIEESRGNPIKRLARRFGAPTVRDDDEWLLYGPDGRRIADHVAAEISADGDWLLRELESLSSRLDQDVSVADGVRRILAGEELSADERRYLDAYLVGLETSTGACMERLSLAYGDPGEGYWGPDLLFPQGYDAIVRGLAEGLDVRLGHRVKRIITGDAGVVLETADSGALGADRAIVTVPLGALKAGSIEFRPELPEAKRQAIARLEMGVLDKVALRFDKPFWPLDVDKFGHVSDQRGEVPELLNWHKFSSQPVLIAYYSADFARRMEALDDAGAVARVMAVVRKIFGRSVPEPSGALVTRWAADPVTRGSYSYVPVGASDRDHDLLAEPTKGGIHFAGEATSRSNPATVHGAYLSGLREAERILRVS